jgi:hypothetical protein
MASTPRYVYEVRCCKRCDHWERRTPTFALAARATAEPVAWLSTVTTDKGTKLQRLGFTRDEAEMANAEPVPLYLAQSPADRVEG